MFKLRQHGCIALSLSACTVASSEDDFGSKTTMEVATSGAGSTGGDTSPGETTAGDESTSDDESSSGPWGESTGEPMPPKPEPMGACPSLGEWTNSDPFLDGAGYSHPLPSFAIDDRIYVHTSIDEQRRLRMATITDGIVGPWTDASSDHGGGPHGFHALVDRQTAYHFRNGHIAEYVFDAQGQMVGDVTLLEDSTRTAFGGDLFVWDAATIVAFDAGPRWVFHLGGFSFSPYEYRQTVRRNALPLGPVFEDTGVAHPGTRPGHSIAFVPPGANTGWLFTTQTGDNGLWRAAVDDAGTLGAWEILEPLPDGDDNGRGDVFTVGRSMFAIRGSQVFRAQIGLDGSLGAWAQQPSLPQAQVDMHWGDGHTEGPSWGVIGEHVVVTGPQSVFAAPAMFAACD